MGVNCVVSRCLTFGKEDIEIFRIIETLDDPRSFLAAGVECRRQTCILSTGFSFLEPRVVGFFDLSTFARLFETPYLMPIS